MIIILIILVLFLLVFIFWEISNLVSLIFGVPFIKTPKEQIKKAFRMADLKPNEMVYDLGSGDGRVLIIAVKDFKARALGFEASPWAYLLSRWNLQRAKITKAKVIFQNFEKADLKHADLIYLYLMPKVIKGIIEKFKNLKTDTKIVSFKFPINGLKLYKEDDEIYVYKI
jgi:predicted RNA methylase